MANITELNQYDENIYLIGTQDEVIGGENGISNLQAKGLANRTNWLRLQLQSFVQTYNTFVNSFNTFVNTLKAAAYMNVGTVAGTVAAGDDSRFYPIATVAEVKAGVVSNKIVDPVGLAAKDGGTLTHYWEIGDWNMDTTFDVTVFNGNVIDPDKIIDISCLIRDDGGTLQKKYPIDYCSIQTGGEHPDGSIELNQVGFLLARRTGGFFDSINFKNTSFNRGWVIVQYLP
jgi:hypothetical protein